MSTHAYPISVHGERVGHDTYRFELHLGGRPINGVEVLRGIEVGESIDIHAFWALQEMLGVRTLQEQAKGAQALGEHLARQQGEMAKHVHEQNPGGVTSRPRKDVKVHRRQHRQLEPL